MSDAVRDYLEKRGCAPHLCDGGLEGLVARWEEFVEEVVGGYSLGLDDYLNDLDLRDILEGALGAAGPSEAKAARRRTRAADERFRGTTAECAPLWGETRERADAVPWWYRRRPLNPGEELREDLHRAGLR
jgi:hypothetical protein